MGPWEPLSSYRAIVASMFPSKACFPMDMQYEKRRGRRFDCHSPGKRLSECPPCLTSAHNSCPTIYCTTAQGQQVTGKHPRLIIFWNDSSSFKVTHCLLIPSITWLSASLYPSSVLILTKVRVSSWENFQMEAIQPASKPISTQVKPHRIQGRNPLT